MRYLSIVIIMVSIFFFFTPVGHAAPDVSAEHAVLLDLETGEILFEKAAFEESPIASITKIMTALLAVESGKMDEYATVSRNAIYTEGSSIYLEQGEKISIKDLIYGLMLRSGNDAAVAIAEHIGESEEGFVFLMNEKASWLGMNHTSFQNAHGLDDELHYSSAFDMALLTREAMQNEVFKQISASKSYKADARSYSWKNKHKLVTGFYQHATGGKTGFTKHTGRTLVTTAEKAGQTLIAVTLNAPNDWNDHISLFEWGFEELQANAEDVPSTSSEQQTEEKNESRSLFPFTKHIVREMMGLRLW